MVSRRGGQELSPFSPYYCARQPAIASADLLMPEHAATAPPPRRIFALAASAALLLGATPGCGHVQRRAPAALAHRADSLHAVALSLQEGDSASQAASITLLREVAGVQARLGRGRALGDAWNVMGHGYHALGQLDSASAAYHRAIKVRERAGDHAAVGGSLNNLGNVAFDRGKLATAVAWYERSLAVHREVGNHTNEASTLVNLGAVLVDSARADPPQLDSALVHYRRALALYRGLGEVSAITATLERLGDAHEAGGRVDSARTNWHAALRLAREHEDPDAEDQLLERLRHHFQGAGQLDSVLVYARLRQGLGASRGEAAGMPGRLAAVAAAHSALQDGDSALYYWRASLASAQAEPDSARIGTALYEVGQQLERAGALDSAGVYFHRSLRVDRAIGDRRGESSSLMRIGRHHRVVGRPDSALAYLRDALALRKEIGDLRMQSRTLREMSDLFYETMRFDSAVAANREALALARLAADRREEADALDDISAYYLNMRGGADSARVYALEALAGYRELGVRISEGWVLLRLGRLHIDTDSLTGWDSAGVYLHQALRTARETGAARLETRVLRDIGRRLSDQGATDSAVVYLRESLALERRARSLEGEVQALQYIGHAYGWAKPKRPDLAAVHYDSAWTALERARGGMRDEASRIAYAERSINAARMLSSAWSSHAGLSGSETSRRLALAAEERGRAQALLDLMRSDTSASARPLAVEADEISAALSRPGLATISYTLGQGGLFVTLTLPSGATRLSVVPVADSTLRRMVGELRQWLQVDGAALRAVPSALEAGSDMAPTQRGLGIGNRASEEGGTQAAARLAALADLVVPDSFRREIQDTAVVRDLVVVPTGVLTLLPFAALPWGPGGEPLGLRYRLRYAPSLTAMIQAEARPQRRDPGRRSRGAAEGNLALVIGNPSMPEVATASGAAVRLVPLPGAEREATLVAEVLDADLLRGQDATETEVRRRMAAADVVHLATHGYAYASEARARQLCRPRRSGRRGRPAHRRRGPLGDAAAECGAGGPLRLPDGAGQPQPNRGHLRLPARLPGARRAQRAGEPVERGRHGDGNDDGPLLHALALGRKQGRGATAGAGRCAALAPGPALLGRLPAGGGELK
jgi:tetratricopeptide (TPR) repeat protein